MKGMKRVKQRAHQCLFPVNWGGVRFILGISRLECQTCGRRYQYLWDERVGRPYWMCVYIPDRALVDYPTEVP